MNTGISTGIHTSYVSAYTHYIYEFSLDMDVYSCVAHVPSFCSHAKD